MATGPCIHAAATATFLALKPGLLTGDGVDLCGEISVHDLGLDAEAIAPARGHRLDWDRLAAALPHVLARRERNVHKGSFGTLGIIGGADGMVGAPLLAGRGALKQGAGKVLIGFATRRASGGGLGRARIDAAHGARRCCPRRSMRWWSGPGSAPRPAPPISSRAPSASPVPMVIDADALNLIAAHAPLRAALRAAHRAHGADAASGRSRAPALVGHGGRATRPARGGAGAGAASCGPTSS